MAITDASAFLDAIRKEERKKVLAEVRTAFLAALAQAEGNKARREPRGSAKKAKNSPRTYTVGKGRGPFFPVWVTELTGAKSHADAKAKYEAGTVITEGKPAPDPKAKASKAAAK